RLLPHCEIEPNRRFSFEISSSTASWRFIADCSYPGLVAGQYGAASRSLLTLDIPRFLHLPVLFRCRRTGPRANRSESRQRPTCTDAPDEVDTRARNDTNRGLAGLAFERH